MVTRAEDWQWVNLPGGHAEQPVVDLCDCRDEDCGSTGLSFDTSLGRGCIVVQTNATTAFHVIFSHTAAPSRDTNEPVLRFVVGKRRNSMTSVGLGNPYLKKEPIEHTKSPDALLTDNPEKSRTYWFLYDKHVGVAAMGVHSAPQADLCRLACRFRDSVGFRAEACESLRYITLASGRRPVSLRIVGVGAPPDVSIPRHRFDPIGWESLPWPGASLVFELPPKHQQLVQRAQEILAKSPIAPFYQLVDPSSICLNVYRLLDPHRKGELFHPGEDAEVASWENCYDEVHRRLHPLILASAPWTLWPLKFNRCDATSLMLNSSGTGCSASITEWTRQVQAVTGLRNGATSREVMTLTFAFEVFPVEGDVATQVRREVVREISALLDAEWDVCELRHPHFVVWEKFMQYSHYQGQTAHQQLPLGDRELPVLTGAPERVAPSF